jgi:hypothetical protein
LIDAPRQSGHDHDPNSFLKHQGRSGRLVPPVNLIGATTQPD